jgi:hypothetical protein
MTGPIDLEKRLTDLLAARAASASPPADAWERIVASTSGRTIATMEATDGEPDLWESLDDSVDSDVEATEAGQRNDDLTVLVFPQPGESSGQQQPRRWLGVAATVAVGTLVVAGVLVVAVNGGEETETIPSPVATDVTDSNAAERPALPTTGGLGSEPRWSRVPHSEAAFGEGFEQAMSGVTVGGPGLVAVGQAGSARPRAAVWTSPDGINWSRIPGHEAIFGEAHMNSVTAGGPGLVAVGSDSAVGDSGDNAVVWTSPDGINWSRVPHDEAILGGADMVSVTAGGPGLVAVGWDGHPQGEESNAVVWTSPDGITWSRVPHDEAVFGNVTGAWMWSVTAGGPGLVAVGDSTDGAAVWTSPDGITWSRVPHDEAVFGDAGMRSVTAGRTGLVAVGGAWREADGGAAVWTSVDGITWSRVPHDEAVFGGPIDQAMTSVTAGGVGLVAVGLDGVNDFSRSGNGDALDAAVWTSVDGIVWSRIAHDEPVFGAQPKPVLEMRSVIAGGPGLVAVGANRVYDTSGATESDAAVWVATLEGCSARSCSDDVTGEAS